MRRSFLLLLGFLLESLASPGGLVAQCTSVMFNGNDTGDVIGLTGVSISDSQINAAANYWAACPSYGQGFPKFTTSSTSTAVTATVVYIGGIGQFCGLATPLSATSTRIELWDQGHDTAGNLYQCNVTDTLAHELGHVLDLANSPCQGFIMGTPPLTNVNGREVAGTRSVTSPECFTVASRWTTSFDRPGDGGPPGGPSPCN